MSLLQAGLSRRSPAVTVGQAVRAAHAHRRTDPPTRRVDQAHAVGRQASRLAPPRPGHHHDGHCRGNRQHRADGQQAAGMPPAPIPFPARYRPRTRPPQRQGSDQDAGAGAATIGRALAATVPVERRVVGERGLSVPAFLADCARRELIRQSLARHSAWCADAGLYGDEADERLSRVLVEARAEGRRLAAAAGDRRLLARGARSGPWPRFPAGREPYHPGGWPRDRTPAGRLAGPGSWMPRPAPLRRRARDQPDAGRRRGAFLRRAFPRFLHNAPILAAFKAAPCRRPAVGLTAASVSRVNASRQEQPEERDSRHHIIGKLGNQSRSKPWLCKLHRRRCPGGKTPAARNGPRPAAPATLARLDRLHSPLLPPLSLQGQIDRATAIAPRFHASVSGLQARRISGRRARCEKVSASSRSPDTNQLRTLPGLGLVGAWTIRDVPGVNWSSLFLAGGRQPGTLARVLDL
jgi:hypothetical protein